MEKPRAEVPLNVYTNAENQTGIERTPASPFSAICPIPKVARRNKNQMFSLRYSMFTTVSQEPEDKLGYNDINKKVWIPHA